ncbi:hypothetical protein EB796_003312 [Bugula neritina]|uniref:DNA repair protein SWI5 homolog n=1 Tax=Bugula neritina TaxID=10212 RepID=A0A7J7KIJ9_BUGNE|nr:hypothetical protein EB796_003312 [Bugula neritina]
MNSQESTDAGNKSSQLQDLQQQIAELKQKGNRVEDLPVYIKALHELNEIKDSAEIVIGKLAEVKAVTVQSVRNDIDLDRKLNVAANSQSLSQDTHTQ